MGNGVLKNDDSKLTEVKAVLDRLQRISRQPNASSEQGAEDGAAQRRSPLQPAEPASAGDGRFSRPIRIASLVRRANTPPLVTAVIVAMVATIAGTAIFVGTDRRRAFVAELPPDTAPQGSFPGSAPVQDAQKSTAAALQAAAKFIASGQVQAARAVLRDARPDESADSAWALARSYDPNFLVTVRAPDAGADVTEATRWYRIWYGLAVKQGLVADSISLERIIRSMN